MEVNELHKKLKEFNSKGANLTISDLANVTNQIGAFLDVNSKDLKNISGYNDALTQVEKIKKDLSDVSNNK
jgi:hypothetical protein